MSENKFIKHLRGEDTSKSVLEIKNQRTITSFANMPQGTSNANDVYSDHRGNAVAVLKGTDNWKLNDNTLTLATTVYGDGRDFTDEYSVGGAGLWVNAVYTFTDAKIFTPNTKWVLKLCGNRLFTESHEPIALTLLIKFGTSTLISKTFFVRENSFNFSEELVIDFDESVSTPVKVAVGDTMTIQVLCGDATAQAEIYNGMTVLTALQRKVDGEAVASDTRTFGDIEDELEDIHDDIDDLKDYTDETFVRLDGNSIMTGPLKMRASISFECAVAPYWHGVGFYKLNDDNSVTLLASMEADDGFCPYGTNKYNIGSNYHKWKNLYLAGKAFISTINNGGDLAVPANTTGTLATKADVDLAANSGRMLTDQGVWYAKMYAATVAPSAEDGTNCADFSQVDGQGNPIIVTYNRVNGAWVQDQTITPPAEYDGYVPITSKIWDITEQAGQQGGRILWNHQSKEFTPYPQIISFEDIEITGESTVIMPYSPSANQIVNKNYVDTLVSNSIGNATITLTQGGQTMGSFTTNQSSDATIALDGGSSYHPDLFDWKWADHICNDVQWLRADTFSWQDGDVYEAAYQHLLDDIGIETVSAYAWEYRDTTVYTKSAMPLAGDIMYTSGGNKYHEVAYDSDGSELYDNYGFVWTRNSSSDTTLTIINATGQTETIAGTTITYYLADDGHKICLASQESNVSAIYTATGVAWYYIIDTSNQRFKLPRRHSQQIVRSVKNSDNTWYRLYADGWVEQGGKFTVADATNTSVNFLIAMANTTYCFYNGQMSYNQGNAQYVNGWALTTHSTTGFTVHSATNGTNTLSWMVCGQSAIDMSSFQDGEKYLYFYVGEFTQTALENTAGLNAELFNEKADLNLANVLANIDFVIERQEPTSANNHTWYRKYRSGWVEQGGRVSLNGTISATNKRVTFPVEMATSKYVARVDNNANVGAVAYVGWESTTGMSVGLASGSSTGETTWEVKGMAA